MVARDARDQIDLAGFFKTTGYWYRTWWLSAVPESDAGRPVGFGAAHSCHVVTSGSLSVLTEAPTAQLYINGKLAETQSVLPLEAVQFHSQIPPFGSNNVTVVCVGEDGKPTMPPQQMVQGGNASAVVLSIDAPSRLTGTGEALVLDGHDVAMLRASIVDANGTLVASSANVSFTVTDGPGRITAAHNGDNHCHEPNNASWHSAYVGLVRAFVQVTQHRVGSLADRQLLSAIDLDTAHVTVPTSGPAPTKIVVTATSPGLRSATIEIPVSTDGSRHGVLSTAERSLQTEQRWA